ncbi:MAG: Gfo/Idh/MocA family oxidoreductase [Bacteroidales bacterium]|nr:Gfo/Idh/MocA family oxidoreductase [Bacteroidales bacterium]MBN2818677.1 Gfo/Idh/MocA family oxidoreductase [Bacteroidales bacterium]
MKTVKWGIIGCGNVTEVKSGPAFNLVDNSKLIAVMRRDADKAADYALRHNIPKWYSNADKLINDKEVNAVYVATPPDSHVEYAIKAIEAGKPVYVEKPMARTYRECKEMVEASKKHNVPIFVAYYRRALPGFLKVKELIDDNQIGKPHTVNIKLFKAPSYEELSKVLPWRVKPEIAGGGHFYDLASHQLDYFDYLFGPVIKVSSLVSNQGGLYTAEDTVSAGFQFENGVIGTGSWCFASSHDSNCDRMEISGESGKITFSCFGFNPIVMDNIAGKSTFRFEKPKHVQQNLIDLVVKAIRGEGDAPSTGETGMRTNWVMKEITKDYYKTLKNK